MASAILTNPLRKLFGTLDTVFMCQEMCHDYDTFHDTQRKCVMIHDTFVDTFLDTVQKRVPAVGQTGALRSEKTPHGFFRTFVTDWLINQHECVHL